MVTRESVEQQLKDIGVTYHGWGRTEISELPNVILPDEKIYECVNGVYEGGFALLVSTNIRVLLIDKKPLRYLNVEDLRFDMINEIDYSHRLFGAQISISTGSKNLRFTSFNQPRLRKLIGHVQNCMAESKQKQSEHEEEQKLHLEQINQQLQAYLLAQHQQQQKLQEQLEKRETAPIQAEPLRPSPELADYLYAQGLLAEHRSNHDSQRAQVSQEDEAGQAQVANMPQASQAVPPQASQAPRAEVSAAAAASAGLYEEGMREVFGNRAVMPAQSPAQHTSVAQPATIPSAPTPGSAPVLSASAPASSGPGPLQMTTSAVQHALDINPLRIASSRLPLAMRNRKFGRPSFHAHSQQKDPLTPAQAMPQAE